MVNYANKALFVDRDGVINKSIIVKNKPFAPRRFEDFEILKNVKPALIKSKKLNFLNIVVTNQPDLSNNLILV